MIEFLDSIDRAVFLFLNGLHSGFFDPVMWWISGKTSWIFLYVLILVWLGFREKWRLLVIILLVSLLVTATDQSSVELFKKVFERPRPCHNTEIKELVHIVNNRCGGKFGFVSSHAANTFGVAMFTSLLIGVRWYGWFIFLWAALVSYSRIYLGVHYPGDIIGGALLGMLWGYAFAKFYFYLARHHLNRIKLFK